MYTRKEYMADNSAHSGNRKKQTECYHRYMAQFVEPWMGDYVLRMVLPKRTLTVPELALYYEEDKHLNNIRLTNWDRLANSIAYVYKGKDNKTYLRFVSQKQKQLLADTGDFYSLSHGVSVFKQAARQLVEEYYAAQEQDKS